MDEPPQIIALPDIDAVGLAFIVITAEPVPEFEQLFASVTFVTVYVVAVVGLTLIEAGLLAILLTVVLTDPSK